MRVLLTGATGLIGKSLGPRLVRDGHELVALVRKPEKALSQLTFPCQIHAWDGERESPPREALIGVDAIIHLAGENIAEKRWSAERKTHLRESRVRSVVNLAEALNSYGVKLKIFITAGAVGYYGDQGDRILTESSAAGGDFLAELCRDWERAAERVPAERTLKLRFGVVLSPLGGFLHQVVPAFERLGASRLGSGRHYLSWVHVDDLIEAIVFSMNNPTLKGPVNIVAPRPLTNAEMTTTMASVLDIPTAPPVPAAALKLRYGELSTALLGSQRAVPRVLESSGFHFKYAEFKQALAAIYPDLKTGEMILTFEQWVPASVNSVWQFFSDENNLARITPSFLGFRVLRKSTENIREGTLIDYRLKVHGLPMNWQTAISRWEPERIFVDEQIKGPYRKWHHTHEFQNLASGTLIRDRIRFQVPMGLLGRMLALGRVLSDVEEIFSYRAKVIAEFFYPSTR